ncbi:MAG TPA: hypothetical protein DD427_01890, partial [Klebsiella pneumoniae]
ESRELPGIKQVKSPSCRMGFLRFCRPASVPVCLPGGAALTGATDPRPPAGRGDINAAKLPTSIVVCFSLLLIHQIQ